VWSIATAFTMMLIFWCARHTLERGGTRTVSRGVALPGCSWP
jgi:hypothetical protein